MDKHSIDFSRLDGRTPGKDGKPDVYIPRGLGGKLVFFLFSVGLTALGVWMLWDPAQSYFVGERGEGRVTRIVRSEPGEPDQVIRVRRKFDEAGHTVHYTYYVEVLDDEGRPHVMKMGVNSQNLPYAQYNDTFEVIYMPGGEIAYGLWHHRTWAFGLALGSVGLILIMLSTYLLWHVGKPIEIDPENPEDLEEEAKKMEEEARLQQGGLASRK